MGLHKSERLWINFLLSPIIRTL